MMRILRSAPVLFLFKAKDQGRRWWGPQNGGNHLPSSEKIETIEQARGYWREHFGGKVKGLVVHSGGREIPIKVRFGSSETHAYTAKCSAEETADCHDKSGPRIFDRNRARCMGGILPTIEHPDVRSVNYGADILFERLIDGYHFLVALNWKDAAGVYEFDSSYHVTQKKKDDMMRQKDRRKNNGPLQKSGPFSSAPSVFKVPSGSGVSPTGSQPVAVMPIGFCRDCTDSVVHMLLMFKGIVAPLDAADITIWRGDEIEILQILKALERSHAHNESFGGGLPAYSGGGTQAIHVENRSDDRGRMYGMAGEEGRVRLRENLRDYDQQGSARAPNGMGAGKRSNTGCGTGDTSQVRQPLLRKSETLRMRDTVGELPGYLQAHEGQGRGVGTASQGEAGQKADSKNSQETIARGELRRFRKGIWCWQGPNLKDLHWKGLAIALNKALGSGERWITVKAPGHDKGQPVIIRETSHGSGTYHVVGGAGGKLNYLKLRGVKSEAEYRQAAGERQHAKREARKQQKESDKKAGTYKAKVEAKKNVVSQKNEHERHFVEAVASAMGWKPEEIAFPAESYAELSEGAKKKAEAKHHREVLKRANDAVDVQRERLVADADARSEVLGEIPLESTDPDTVSVQDLDPIEPEGRGLGYATDYKERAAAHGLTELELEDEAGKLKEQRLSEMTPEKADAIRNRVEVGKRIQKELETVRPPSIVTVTKLADAQQAVALIKAQKALKAVQKQAKQANQEIDQAVEPKAYVLEVGQEAPDEAIQDDLANDLRTVRTRAFLSKVAENGSDYEKTLARHIGAGAYSSMNALSLTAASAGLIERDAVDVLGIAGAAQVLARRLRNDLSADEMTDLHEALEQHHLKHYLEASDEALREAMEWQDVAREIDTGQAVDGRDLARAQELNAKRRDAIAHSHQTFGTALGEMEANAALIVALKETKRDETQVSLGNLSFEDSLRQVRAIGLERGDYQINAVGANKFLTVNAQGMDRLTKPVNREDMARMRTTMDIIEGRQDEDNWLPKGMANRPDLAMHTPPGAVPRLAEPFAAGADLGQSISNYIGGRTADGDPPADIVANLLSQDVMEQVGDRRDEYMRALNTLAPMHGADGKTLRVETHQEAFEAMADRFVADRHGNARAPIHRQHVTVDQVSVDALHRALSDEPTGIAAFKPLGDLDHKDQQALRKHFAAEVAKDDGRGAGLRDEIGKLEAQAPERETKDMFGEMSTNPDWTAWKQARDAKAREINAAALTWPKYVEVMGSPEKAYAAMQDLVRSKVTKAFQEAHNTLRPGAPLKLGRTVLRGNIDHLDAVDQDARERRLAEQRDLVDRLRNRDAGRYAAGSVGDKLAQSREAIEAMHQSQMGFFATTQEADGAEQAQPLAKDERYTLGHAAERQLAAMMPIVGKNFQPGRPTKLWQLSMNGKFINQQRAVKLIDHNKRVVLAQGTGSGKTAIGLAAFAHLHEQGKAKKGIFAVPSIVQGQFSGEALRYLEPGKFKWHIEPGASRESRIAAYKDPDTHFSVVTHQSLRDDLLYLGAKRDGVTEGELSTKIEGMTAPARRAWMKGLMEAEGIKTDYMMVDEGHDLLNRAGKQNSRMANTLDALSANVPHYVSASVSGDMSILVDWNGAIQRITMQEFSERVGLAVGEIRSGLGGVRVRCFDWNEMRMGWAPVTAIHKFDASEKRCYEIIGAYGKRIVVTEDHSCYVWRDGQALLVRGDEVRISDQLIIETLIDQESEPADKVDLLAYMGDAKAVVFGDFPEIANFSGADGYRYRKCGKHGPYLPLGVFRENGCDARLVARVSSIRGDSWCEPVLDLKNIAYLIGLYIGDGCLRGNSIQLVMHEREVDPVMDELRKIKGMNLRLYKRKKKNCAAWEIRVQNYPLAMLFRSWFGGMRSKTKRVPSEIFAASVDVKHEVLRGYEDSDGYRSSANRVTYTSCSRALLEDMGVLLGFLGITFAIKKRSPCKKLRGNRFDNGGDAYYLTYTDGSDARVTQRAAFIQEVMDSLATGERHHSIAGRFGVSKQFVDAISCGRESSGSGSGRPMFPLSASAARVPIRSIREVREEFVYDISVDDAANFIANGILTHNTADPIKNDQSEIFDSLAKMDPDRYTDRAAFMRRYGVDTVAAKEGLRRELARHFYPGRIESGNKAHKKEIAVPLSAGQHQALEEVDKMLARAKLARMNGKVDVDAVKHLSPGSFADVDPARHEEIAKTLQDSLGIIKNTAIRRVIDTHADNAKVDRLSQLVTERHGKPGVVFAHSREAVRQIAERLKKEGHRVVTITGADSAKEKEAKRLAFRPEKGEPTADIMVASDAGAVGMNAQRGQWLVQFDTPMTSKTHAQRNGRIDRLGQKNEVELIDLVADHPSEHTDRKRLATKYGLRDVLTSPLEGLDDTGLAHELNLVRSMRAQASDWKEAV